MVVVGTLLWVAPSWPKDSHPNVVTDPGPESDIQYLNPEIPDIPPPEYPGERYEALVPATLDLAERAKLALNAITEMMNPNCDMEMYWNVDLLDTPPRMGQHWCGAVSRGKFFEAIPLCRTMCGSLQNHDREQRLMQIMLQQQGKDGLVYVTSAGRPWAREMGHIHGAGTIITPSGDHVSYLTWHSGRVLAGMSSYALLNPDGPWREAADRLAGALMRATIMDGDTAFLFHQVAEPGWKASEPEDKPTRGIAASACQVAHGLVLYDRLLTADPQAPQLAKKLMRYVLRDSGLFGPDGEFMPDMDMEDQPGIHFHNHAMTLPTALDVVQATGDKELLERVIQIVDYLLDVYAEPTIGYFPIWLNKEATQFHKDIFHEIYSSEGCALSDMVTVAIMLSRLGIDRWDDADRWVRNHFAEAQLTRVDWVGDGILKRENGVIDEKYFTTDRVAERSLGAFAGWPMPNDWQHPYNPQSIMNCCTVNGAKALYYVWRHMLSHEDGTLRVHLLLNRASKCADIDSHIPYTGRVDVKIKQDLNFEMRIPEWVEPKDVKATVDDRDRDLTFDGRYAQVGAVKKGQTVVMTFPICERTVKATMQGTEYTMVLRGNTVVSIEPQGKYHPLYQRGHYRTGETLWKKVTRFVPENELDW